jgi:hypothetical protein
LKKVIFISVILISTVIPVYAQLVSPLNQRDSSGEVYRINYKVETPILVVSAAVVFYNFSQISAKQGSSESQIEALKIRHVNDFDRGSIHPYSKSLDQASYIPFYIAIPLPLLCLLDNRMRHDFFRISYLYLEALSATGLLYSSAVNSSNRYRPFTYEKGSPMELAVQSNAKKSFFAGHVALVATSTFFMAKVYADYHPESKLKWVFYGGAGVLTAATGYMRNYAGMHFLSDVLFGAAAGTLSGLLVPALHKFKPGKRSQVSLLPFSESGMGMTALFSF